jgi:5-formyltetrahydrofolate cyclo-ligase
MQKHKQKLRKNLLNQRQALSHSQWQEKSQQICDRVQSLSLFKEAKTVLAYFSFRQEPDLSSLFNFPVQWGFPRCVERSLVWHLWQAGETLQIGKYGISEPLTTAPKITPQEVDLIIVPTVACDRRGYRLGYGGGFYDRLLNSSEWLNIPTVGVVFDFAYLSQLPVDSWDLKLNYICTENTHDCIYKPR